MRSQGKCDPWSSAGGIAQYDLAQRRQSKRYSWSSASRMAVLFSLVWKGRNLIAVHARPRRPAKRQCHSCRIETQHHAKPLEKCIALCTQAVCRPEHMRRPGNALQGDSQTRRAGQRPEEQPGASLMDQPLREIRVC